MSPTAQIWSLEPVGGAGEHRLISREYEGVVRPQWSPDGKRIAFLSDDRPGQSAFVAAATGKDQKQLLPSSAREVHAISWSPDGKAIAFSGTVGQATGLFLASLSSKKTKLLARTPASSSITAPAFSPDGTRIAYTVSTFDPSTNLYGSVLWSVAPDGSQRTRVQRLGASYGFGTEDIFSSTWSPDGTKIAAASPTNRGSVNSDGAQIVVMNANGTALRTLTTAGKWNWYPSWSPDGKRIAFASNRSGQFQIYAMNPDGSQQTRLTHDRSFDTAPDWQPLR